MKGTLLLLTLLVIGELGFQTTEACGPFFDLFMSILSGVRLLLKHKLSYYHPTMEETVAFEKLQDCYNEAGSLAKMQDIRAMKALLFSSECVKYYSKDMFDKLVAQFTQLSKTLGSDPLDNSSS